MRKTIITFTLLIILSFLTGCGNSNVGIIPQQEITQIKNTLPDPMALPGSDEELGPHKEGEIIVRYKKGLLPEEIAKSSGGTLIDKFTIGDNLYLTLRISSGKSIVKSIENLRNSDGIVYAEPNYKCHTCIIPDDTFYNRQYAPQHCNAEAGWNINRGDPNLIIAIIDTGVDGQHSEFSGKMVDGYDFCNNKALIGTENNDDDGHGTHCAGIAAAKGNNGNGIAGVAWNCKIMPVKVLDGGPDGNNNVARGIEWARLHGAKVISMSLGYYTYSQTMFDAIQKALDNNITIVVAMGNDGNDQVEFPAGNQGVIAAGAIDGYDRKTSFSTTGSHISISAPGYHIYSTFLEKGYTYMNGTSMSTPFIAGVCALILSAHPELTPDEVKSQLEETATDLETPGWDKNTGWGKPDIEKALGRVLPGKYGKIKVSTVPPRKGLSLVLFDSNNKMISPGVTNENGVAYFYSIPSGSYIVKAFDAFKGELKETALDVKSGTLSEATVEGFYTPSYQSFSSGDINLSIPDNSPEGITSAIRVSNTGTVADVRIIINITHPSDPDLTAYLTGPDKTQITIFERAGRFSGDDIRNFVNTIFDEQALIWIIDGVPPFSGKFKPQEHLTVFRGKNAGGDWTLKIADTVEDNTGTLNNWVIEIGE